MFLWFVFCAFGKVAKVLRMFVFPQVLGLLGGVAFLLIFVWKV